MQSTDIPTKFPIPFANGAGVGLIRTIPTASQIGVAGHDGWASLTDGFPPVTFNPVAAGGIPPFGQDANGIFNQTTAWARWVAAGAPLKWDSGFSTAISGYPKGAQVASATTFGLRYLCIVEANTSNPDTGGAGWLILPQGFRLLIPFYASGTLNVPDGVTSCRSRLWGGGGSGGGVLVASTPSASSGGSGGGYSEKYCALVPLSAVSVTVAAAVLGGNGTPTNGTNGQTTSLGAFHSATGGGPGFASSSGGQSTVSAGGNGVGGDLNLQGGTGSGGNPNVTNGGAGGPSPLGIAGAPSGSIGGTGAPGQTPGGGGGGTSLAAAGGLNGGPGGPGLALVEI